MSDLPPPTPDDAVETEASSGRWKTWHLVVALVAALLVGVGIGAAGEESPDGETAASNDPSPAPTVTVTETVTETETVAASPQPAETVTVTATPTEAGGGGDGTLTADQYRFTDVQVNEDFAGDFTARAQVTNTGSDTEGVIWTMTFLAGGSVVGTADGTAQEFAAGETITVEFTGTDDYTDFDEVRVQVDTQF